MPDEDSSQTETQPQGASSSTGTALVPVAAPSARRSGSRGWLSRLFGYVRADLGNGEHLAAADALPDSAEQLELLNNIRHLRHVRVEDLMVPRADIEAVEIGIELGALLKLFEESGHSRMPVYVETLDDPRGMIYIRDVVAYITRSSETPKSSRRKVAPHNLDLKRVGLDKPLSSLKLVRPVLFVPHSMPAMALLGRMQASRTQMALVIDEYGGTEGLVSLEDIVEVIVGDIEDEHDEIEVPLIDDKGSGTFVVDAKAELEDVAVAIGSSFQTGEMGEDIDTIGGLVAALAGRVPVRGEVVEGLGFEFRVIDADPRRIKRLEIAPSSRRRARKAD